MTEATDSNGEAPKTEGTDIKAEAAASGGAEADAKAAAGETGTSLAPATEKPSGVDPFIAIAEEATPTTAEPRPLYARALDYSAHAAMVVGLVGFAWTVSDHVVTHHPASATATPAKLADAGTQTPAATADAPKPAEAKVDPVDELRKSNQKMASEIRNLRASLEALRTTVVRERTAAAPESSRADVRSIQASLDTLKSSLAGTKSEQSAAIAQLSAKVEKLQREEKAPQPIAERKPDRQQLDTATTASIPSAPPKSVPTPPSKPTTLASAEPTDATSDKPQVVSGWVVRDVYQGVALIEGRRGQMEVVPGVSIPGAGIVKSIERHNGAWTVTTTKGQLAYEAPSRESHRGGYQRDYYGARRWDF